MWRLVQGGAGFFCQYKKDFVGASARRKRQMKRSRIVREPSIGL
jgi:hypothetical protein